MQSTITIEDATECLIDYRGKTPPKSPSGVRLITAKVVKNGQITDEYKEFIAEDFYHKWMRRGLPKRNDVLITTEAPLGEVAMLRASERIALAQRIILLRAKHSVLDSAYLFYALQSEFCQNELKARGSGTTVHGIKQSELRKVRIPYVPLPQQRKIARVLSAYDSLIENNQRRIEILDEMARALYREWFLDFRFPGHKEVALEPTPLGPIPRGWSAKKLSDVARVNRAQISPKEAPREILYIDISSVSVGRINQTTTYSFNEAPGRARRVIQHGDVLWSCVRPNRRAYALLLHPKPHTIASTGFAVLTATEVPYTFLYLATTTDAFVTYLTNNATGSAYPAITGETFEKASVIVPPAALLEAFADLTIPLAEQAHLLDRQVRNLMSTRDLLLPRLISGEIRLDAA